MKFQTESQIWAYLAEEYERGHSDKVSLTGICVSLASLVLDITWQQNRDCVARLRKRFKPRPPRWWQFWRALVTTSAYYWPVGETEPRAKACHQLFLEAFAEEKRQEEKRQEESP